MGPQVAVFFVPIAFFAAIAWTIKVISDNRTRRRLIDSGATEGMVAALFANREQDPNVPASLKWGLVTVGVGLALVIVQFLPYDFEEPIAYGLMLLFAGAGLLIYYRMAPGGEQASTSPSYPSPSEKEPVT